MSAKERHMDISVIVCTYNRADMLRRALASLAIQNLPDGLNYEVVVVDDGSTDATAEVIREAKRCTDRPVVHLRENGIGISAARNAGVRAARGTWLAFTDDDQIADSAWLRNLCYTQQQTNSNAIGGARMLELPARVLAGLPRQIRLILGEIEASGAPHVCSRDALVCTGNLLIRKALVEELGGFDESLTQGGEDTDLFMRLRRAGHECWFTPYALVHHIIPEYRLESAYLLWASLRGGDCYARRDLREWGILFTWFACIARVSHGISRHVPALLLARLQRDEAKALASRCSLWRVWGYAKRVAQMSVPSVAGASSEASAIDFRSERKLFHNS